MVRAFTPSRDDIRQLVRLAVPIATVQVGVMLMGTVSTMIMGRVDARELAAVALGNLYIYGLSGFGMGVAWAVDPIVSQALGADDHESAALGVQRGLVLSVWLGVALALLCLPAGPVLALLRQPAEVIPAAQRYIALSAPGLPLLLVFLTLRQSLQAMKRTRAIVAAIVVGNVVNAVLHQWWVFGGVGVPALGSVGSALASLAARLVMVWLLLLWARHDLRRVLQPWRPESTALAPLWRVFRIGLPIGLQNSVEITTFGAIMVMAGWFGSGALGGHQVAMNAVSLLFMVPLGVGSAASVLVGRSVGAGDAGHARRIAASALLVGVGYMALSATLMRLVPHEVARLYTDVPAVAMVAASLLPIAGVFQVFDGMQVVAAGVLRGAGDTRAPLLANLFGFWFVGLPVSVFLGLHLRQGVTGLWWGFVAGLAAVALFLLLRVRVLLMRPLRRLEPGAGGRMSERGPERPAVRVPAVRD
jgi:MATE family multidrug resistance protein